MQPNSAFAQQPQRNQVLETQPAAAEDQIGGSGDESDSLIIASIALDAIEEGRFREAIEPAEGELRSSGSLRRETETLASIREAAKAALAQIAEGKLLAIAAVSPRYEKRLRDEG